MNHLVPRDEREQGIDHAADRLAYLVLSFGLLAIVAYRRQRSPPAMGSRSRCRSAALLAVFAESLLLATTLALGLGLSISWCPAGRP